MAMTLSNAIPAERGPRASWRKVRESATGLAVALVVTLLPGASAATDNVDLKRGVLGHLFPVVGTFHYETVLADPTVEAAIDRMLGPVALYLPDSFQIIAPIDFVGGALVLSGQASQDEGAFQATRIWVDLRNGFVAVAVKHEGAVTAYTEDVWESSWIFGFRSQTRALAAHRLEQPLPQTFTWFDRGEPQDPARFRWP